MVKKIYRKAMQCFWRILSMISPEKCTKLLFYLNMKKKLNLCAPTDINEKIQYLKLNQYYNNKYVTKCADKYMVRQYLCNIGLEHLLPHLYGVYNHVGEINWDELPDSFAMKCNHACGYNIICEDKSKLNIEASKKQLKKWLKDDYWKNYAETQYKYIPKKIVVEEYLGADILTYKFYCFNGQPRLLYVSSNGEDGEKDKYIDYFDMEWNHLDVSLEPHPNNSNWCLIERPDNLEAMIEYARKLSSEFPFVRIDLYNVNGKIYLSEMTFIPTGGFMKLHPSETGDIWGSWLNIV